MKKLVILFFASLFLCSNVLADLSEGIVAYYDFEGDAKDITNNGYNGTPNGEPEIIEGKIGQCYNFDGENNYINLEPYSFFDNEISSRTYSLWFFTSDAENRQVIYEEGGKSNGINIYLENNKLYIGAWSEGNGYSGHWFATNISTDNWHHVVLNYNSSGFKAYLNGNEVGSKSPGVNINNHGNDDNIGKVNSETKFHDGDFVGDQYYFKGKIDEFGIWNSNLTEQEIINLYNNGNGKKYSDLMNLNTNLISYFSLNNNAKDNTENKKDGTVKGATLQNGKISQCYEFDGDGDIISLEPHSFFDSIINSRTYSLWFYPHNTKSRQMIYHEGGTIDGINIYIDNGKVYVGAYSESNNFNGYWYSKEINPMNWYHVVLKYSPSEFSSYLNGKKIGSKKPGVNIYKHGNDDIIGGVISNTKFHDGDSEQEVNGCYFKGKIDEIGIWERILSLSELKALYNNGKGLSYDNFDDYEFIYGSISGTVVNQDNNPIPNAKVNIVTGPSKSTKTDSDGKYLLSNLKSGYGYELQASAFGYKPKKLSSIVVNKSQHVKGIDFTLKKGFTGPFAIKKLSWNPNPKRSEIGVGGTAYRYYQVIDKPTGKPAESVPVYIEQLPDSIYYSGTNGIVKIAINSDLIGNAESQEEFTINKVGDTNLDPESQITFEVAVETREYEKTFKSSVFGELGISYVSLEFNRAAKLNLKVENSGTDTEHDSLLIQRQGRAGGGVSYGVQSPANVSLGPVEAGAEAEVGVNVNGLTEDRYKFPYYDMNKYQAVAQYILYASGNYNSIDQVLIALLSACENWLSDQSSLSEAYIGDMKGLSFKGYGNAEAKVGTGLGEHNQSFGFGAGINGNVKGEGKYYYNYHKDIISVSAGASAEVSGSANAGISFNQPYPSKAGKNGIFFGTQGNIGGTIGAEVGANMVDDKFDSFWLSLLRGYSYGAGANLGFEKNKLSGGIGADKECVLTYDFTSDQAVSIVENAADLPVDLKNMAKSSGGFSVSKSTFGNILYSSLDELSDQQSNNPNTSNLINYQKSNTIREPIKSVDMNIGLSATGEKTISAEVGGGYELSQSYEYIGEKGKFYNWKNYPLVKYSEPKAIETSYGDIIKNISEDIPWSIKSAITGIKTFSNLFGLAKSTNTTSDTVKCILNNDNGSYIVFYRSSYPDTLTGFKCHNWSWWGKSADINKSNLRRLNKSTAAIQRNIKIRSKIKKAAQEEEKLEYGIGGFYQFDPYNAPLKNNKSFINIKYSEQELNGIDENNLAVFKENKEDNKWEFIGGTVNTDSNYVTANIDTLGTFTLAPIKPTGKFGLKSDSDTLTTGSNSVANIESDPIYNDDGSIISDGTIFTVTAERGTILTADSNPNKEFTQLESKNGKIAFKIAGGDLPLKDLIEAKSVQGDAKGATNIVFTDEVKPAAPQLLNVTPKENKLKLRWSSVNETDIAGYKIYFDTDKSGSPYNGNASVIGEPSPIDAGTDTSMAIKGLDTNKVYYCAIKAYDLSGNESEFSNELTIETTGCEQDRQVPEEYKLSQNYPNPFNASTNIKFSLPNQGNVKIDIYNILGQKVRTLVNGNKPTGSYNYKWNGKNDHGVDVASGIYIYRMKSENYIKIKKMTLLK